MIRSLFTLFVAGLAILLIGEFWQGDYKPAILLVGAGFIAIPFAIAGVILASAMVERAFGAVRHRHKRVRAPHRRTIHGRARSARA